MMDLAMAAERREFFSLLLREFTSSLLSKIEDYLDKERFSGRLESRYRMEGFRAGESDSLS